MRSENITAAHDALHRLHSPSCGCMACVEQYRAAVTALTKELQSMRAERDAMLSEAPAHGGIRLVAVEQDTLTFEGKPVANNDPALTFALAPAGVQVPLMFKMGFGAWCALNDVVTNAMLALLGLDVSEPMTPKPEQH